MIDDELIKSLVFLPQQAGLVKFGGNDLKFGRISSYFSFYLRSEFVSLSVNDS